MCDIETIWGKIQKYKDVDFETYRKVKFKYKVDNDRAIPYSDSINVDYAFRKGEVEKALKYVPCSRPGGLSGVRSASYIWAVLHDDRIYKKDCKK